MRAVAIAGSLALLGLLGIAPPARAEAKSFTAAMTAAEETPPGPQGGTGAATVTIDLATSMLCYDVSWSKEVENPNAGHIHKGAKGTPGPVVVSFSLPDRPKDCIKADANALKQISADPAGHYINIHNNRYPGGAIRGQLKAA